MIHVNMMEWMVTSSILILILLGVRALCAGRISLRLRYALWLVAAVRLLVPVSLALPSHPMPLTAANLAPAAPAVLERPITSETAGGYAVIPPEGLEASGFYVEEDGGVTADDPGWYPVLNPETGTVEAYYGGWTLGDTLWAIWAAGAGLAGLVFLGANLRFARQMKARRRPVEGAECPLPLYEVEGLASPCLFGLFRPAIYLTPGVEGEALEHVLAHELTHHAHKDHIWAVVRCLCLFLHWYNPLVWLAAILSKRDGELACDEGAVARLGEERRLSYGRTLVDLVAGERRPADLLTCSTTMTEGTSSIRRRVETLVKHPRTVKTVLFALTAVVVLAVVFTFAKEEPAPTDGGFSAHVNSAEAICVFDPPISSHLSCAAPIRDGDLLAEAKKLLTTVPLEGPVEGEFPQNAAFSQALRLALTQADGSEPPYYILGRAGVYYVGLMDIPTLGDFFPIAQLKKWDIYALSKLSREQFERNNQREEAGDHAAFLARLEEAKGIKMKQSGFFTNDSGGMIVGMANLAQAKAMLRKAEALTAPVEEDFAVVWNKGYTLRLYPNINSEEDTSRYYLFEGADGQWYLLNSSQQPIALLPQEIEASHLYALAWEELPEQTKYEVTYPALREELKNLFLGDEDTVTACTGNDPERVAEMEDWLTNWTSGYIIQYDIRPTGQPYTEPAWFARAVDAGSFYSINIPDHLVQPVLSICREQEGYHQNLHDMYRAESMVFSSPASPHKRIIPLHGAASLSELLMGEGMRTEQTITSRLDIREADAVLTYTLEGQTLVCYLQETEEGCLISIVRGGRVVSAPIPVMGILPAGMSERLAALVEEMGEHTLPASTLEFMRELQAQDIFEFSLGHGAAVEQAEPDREALVSLIHRAAEQRVERDYDMFDHNIWSLTLYVVGADGQPYLGVGDNQLTLSVGTEEDVVCFYYQFSNEEDGYYVFAQSPELYDLVCSFYIQPETAIVQTDVIPVQEDVAHILRAELDNWNGAFTENGQETRYTGAELTEFRLLTSYPDLIKGRKVNLYAFDYGLTMDDLEEAVWAGGNYADGKGRFHPYGMALHLLTVERPSGQKSKVESWRVIPWEYRLEVGQPDFEDTVDREEVLSVILSNLESLLNPVIPADVTDPQQVAEEYGKALAGYYLSLGGGHPKAVTYAQLAKAEVYQQAENGLCALITLAVDPVEPNSVHWMAGSGLDRGEDGHWLYTLEYRLERREEDGAWMCTDRGTGGVSLPEFQWSASQSFEPDMAWVMDWNTDLRAVATRLDGNGGTAMGASGETGALMNLEVSASGVEFTAYFDPARADTYAWGETLDALAQAGWKDGEQSDPSAQNRAAVSRWLRVTRDGEDLPGVLRWSTGDVLAQFRFEFDQLQTMEPREQIIIEIGPKA